MPTKDPTALLRQALDVTGLSQRAYAKRITYQKNGVSEFAVRHWLAGNPMPPEVEQFLLDDIASHTKPTPIRKAVNATLAEGSTRVKIHPSRKPNRPKTGESK